MPLTIRAVDSIYSFAAASVKATVNLLPANKRLFAPFFIAALFVIPATRQLVLDVLADAFWAVSVFVAATLALYHLVSIHLKKRNQFSYSRTNAAGQILFASIMGALPGCGGAIIVVTQFVAGRLSFGAVVAVLVTTMGDAAFVLLVREPMTAVCVIGVSLLVGFLSGVITHQVHGYGFLRPAHAKEVSEGICCSGTEGNNEHSFRLKLQGALWRYLLIPGTVIGFMIAAQIDVERVFELHDGTLSNIGAVVAFILVLLWSLTSEGGDYQSVVAEDKKEIENKMFQKIALDTNFVTSWVVLALLGFELTISFYGLNLADDLKQAGYIIPLLGVLVGLIPGCGPQIMVTSTYLQGVIPFSALLGNAISNDGDALFPAIALAPKAALWATLYSTVPAVIVSYAYYLWFE